MLLILHRTTAPLLLSFFLLTVTLHSPNFAADQFELKDGDRVVFLGSEFVEQQIKHNYLEAELTLKWPAKRIHFRNLGWSGDTPSAIARGYFGGAPEGFRRLLEELDRIEPTVIFVCYGANSHPDSFEADFRRLHAELNKRASRIIVVSHPAADSRQAQLAHRSPAINHSREKSRDVLRAIVDTNDNSTRFIDLYDLSSKLLQSSKPLELTHDPIRYNAAGYQQLANAVVKALGLVPSGQANGQLRRLIAEKNELYFHRYRPQNETYLRGFRKHEQGQNAVEIGQFDALITHSEQRIAAMIQGQPLPTQIIEPDPIQLTFEALPPEQQRKLFTLHEGLEISLFASEPMIANPIHMNFDSRGRLWVATSPIYPQIKPGAKPRDEIIILEDTDNDGKADKRTVFADDLLIPTAVLPDENGGAYVANSTELIHLSDNDGDGKADSRRVVLAGFGTEDTHHIIHTFRWGPDTSLFFNQSIYIHTHMETPHGVRRLMGSGIWRFETDSLRANILMRGLVNPWGHIFDEWGQSFATDGAGGDGINYAFPGSAYPTAVGFRKVLRGLNPGQPKHCGLERVSGAHFDETWQGTLVTNDFRGNRINRFQLSEQSSGYASKQLPDLLSSSHRAFRPVDVKMAPDGSLMIADWYNPIINHGEVDFRDSRRDYKHGRIWRVTQKDRTLEALTDFRAATIDDLVKSLKHPGQWNRVQARIELKRRDPSTVAAAVNRELWSSKDPLHQLEALWTMSALDAFVPLAQIQQAMNSEDHRLRAAVVRILANDLNPTAECLSLVAKAASDSHPRVRLEFVHAWRRLHNPADVRPLMRVLDHPLDPNIEFALNHAISDTSSSWIEEFLATDAAVPVKLESFLFVLDKVQSPLIVPRLLSLLDGDLDRNSQTKVIQMVAQRGSPQQLKSLFDSVAADQRAIVIQALLQSALSRKVVAAIEPSQLYPHFQQPGAIHLAGFVGSRASFRKSNQFDDLNQRLVDLVAQSSTAQQTCQLAAIDALALVGGWESISRTAETHASFDVQQRAIKKLAQAQPEKAAKLVAGLLRSGISPAQAGSLVDIFLVRKGGGNRLAKAIKGIQLSPKTQREIIARGNAKGSAGKILVNTIRKAVAAPMKKSWTKAEVANLIERVDKEGNPTRGENVYRRPKLNCIKCHSIGGAGGVVGPDLISLGASSPVDYIVDSMINPSAKIKEGYHTTTVVTSDGQQVSGKLMSQVDGQLILRDADDREHVFDEDDIEDQKISTVSLMPADLTAELTQTNFIDLIAFLSSLGKDGPFKVPTEKFIRRWKQSDGGVVFSRVDGSLPLDSVAGNTVSFEIEVIQPGTIGVHVENPNGLRITRNEMKDNLRAEKIIGDLPKGVHRFTIQLLNRKRKSLKIKLFDVEKSNGVANLVNQ